MTMSCGAFHVFVIAASESGRWRRARLDSPLADDAARGRGAARQHGGQSGLSGRR